MGDFTDFPGGLTSAYDYLNPTHHLRAELTGSVADISRLVISAEFDINLKEIICSLLAGNGLKLPNIQICISLNLKELLGIVGLQQALYDALNSLSEAMDKFLDHLKIEEVLSRINGVLAEITSIANMINFCSAPLDPIAIPNILETAMQSLLGTGKELIDRIGTLIPDQIGGCLIDGEFNCAAFNGGILGSICDNLTNVTNGTADDAFIESIVAEVTSVVTAIDDLIDEETNTPGSYDVGGSDFEEAPTVNDGIGVLHNPTTIQQSTRIASQLKGLYDNLGSYQVIDSNGTVYNNIFETFVEPGMLSILRRTTEPKPRIAERVPVYNYCNEIIGYTDVVTQSENSDASEGELPGTNDQPGYKAGGIITDPIQEAEDLVDAGGGTVVNNITNITNVDGSGVLFADSEAAMIALNVPQGQIVYRTDNNITYVDNGGEAGTIADFNTIGSATLSTFLTEVNGEVGSGLLTRIGDTSEYRTITGTANQLTVVNGAGQAGNPTVSITNNPVIPGTDAVVVPSGTTAQQVSTTNGAIRYNTTLNQFEGFQSGAWAGFATGAAGVSDGLNVGGAAYEVYKQNNVGTLEFRTFAVSGAITMNTATDVITVSETLTGSSLGGTAAVFSSRTTNDFQFRGITAGAGISVTENANDIVIASTDSEHNGSTTTTDATATEVLFSGSRQTPTSGNTWLFEVTVVAKKTNTTREVTAIRIEGIIDNNGGTVTIAGTEGNKTIFNSTSGTSNYDMLLDIVTNQFRVRVQGDTGHDVTWDIRYKYQEV